MFTQTSREFIKGFYCSHDKSCPGENLISTTTIWINSSFLINCCAQSQCGAQISRLKVSTELCPSSKLTRARLGIWIWAGAELTPLDLTPSCSALPGNPHHLTAAQTWYHELCFRPKHAVTRFKIPKYHKFNSSWANSSRCVHTVPLGSWFSLSECQILQRY